MARATAKAPVTIDTTLGSRAHALAVEHAGELAPRLPAGTVETLAEDLETLGADPSPPTSDGEGTSTTPAAPPPSLPEAMATAVTLITAVHASIRGAKARPEVRKATAPRRRRRAKRPER